MYRLVLFIHHKNTMSTPAQRPDQSPRNRISPFVAGAAIGATVACAAYSLWGCIQGVDNTPETPETAHNTMWNLIEQCRSCLTVEVPFDPCSPDQQMTHMEFASSAGQHILETARACLNKCIASLQGEIRIPSMEMTLKTPLLDKLKEAWSKCPQN